MATLRMSLLYTIGQHGGWATGRGARHPFWIEICWFVRSGSGYG